MYPVSAPKYQRETWYSNVLVMDTNLSLSGSSVDVALPFTVLQLFPASGRSMRRLEEEQAGLYKWVENLLDR